MYYKYVIVNQSLIMSKSDARTEVISTVIQKIGPKKFTSKTGIIGIDSFIVMSTIEPMVSRRNIC